MADLYTIQPLLVATAFSPWKAVACLPTAGRSGAYFGLAWPTQAS